MPPGLPAWMIALITIIVAMIVVIFVHRTGFALLRRIARRSKTMIDDMAITHLERPALWLLILLVLGAIEPTLPIPPGWDAIWKRILGLAGPGLTGWMVLALLAVARDAGQAQADISVADNLMARRRRTRIGILHRIAVFVVLLVTFCVMLMSIPAVRSVGVTLAASAGLAALAVGAAAQPALKNLIAGIQMAFTAPIRIDDVVIMDGEWGRIEDIRLTFVVVKIWDERRLIVPVSKFLEESFQNWTRETSQILGTVFLFVDPTADVARIRAKLDEVVRTNPNWDGRVIGLQVTDLHADHMELRALVSAADASKAFDLRCDVREALMAFIASDMPEALPRFRRQVSAIEQHPQPAQPAAAG
jgi:small-conductance mechanosensitive channel